jgi:hypothetical protein
MSVSPGIVARLGALDARTWAHLLRALRRQVDVPAPLAVVLARPTGELASGPARRALCEVLAESEGVLDVLRREAALPDAARSAISPEPEPVADGRGAGAEDEESAGSRSGEGRDPQRARALRRTLEEERRRREGADARATSAEARAREVESERDALQGRVAELEASLAAAHDAVGQSVARAERRSVSRLETVERELTAERSAHSASRRDLERTVAELESLRDELELIRSREVPEVVTSSAEVMTGRPLVLPQEIGEGTTEAARWLASRANLLLVDGYNAALLLRPNRPLEEQRRWLVERMRPLVVRGGARPVVIFDGDGATGRMRETGGVEVRFTVRGTIADDEIVFAVAATDDPVLVVTDDSELADRVRAEGGNVIGSLHLPGIIDA